MNNNLTDRSFWKTYWKNYQYGKVPQKMFFDRFLPKDLNHKSFIEIGGFPGTMSAYFHQKYGCSVSLLDFYIDEEMVRETERVNDIKPDTIACIEQDFFNFSTDGKYDIVFSLGFIEHFNDTRDVILRHVDLLASGGLLLIVLPNLLGLNGWIQRRFDKENYDAHNLKSMEIDRLKKIMATFSLKDLRVEYTRKPIVWLEPKAKTSLMIRWMVKMMSYAIKLFSVKGKFLSPYIVIAARK